MKVSIVNFSGHKGGNGDQIASYIAEHMRSIGHEVEVIHFSDIEIHGCGKCTYPCFIDAQSCPYFDDDIVLVYRTIASSDLCFYIVPNYSDVPCSNYFILRERSQCVVGDQLWRDYAKTKKHFLVISSTSKDYFKSLLQNEITDQKLEMTFLNSNIAGSKKISGDFLEYAYFRNLLDQIIAKYG